MAEVSLEQAPRKARDLYEKGYAAMERGNLDYAMDMFMAALDLEPGLLRARKFLRAAQIKKKGIGNRLTHVLSMLQGVGTYLGAMSSINKKPLEALKGAEKLLRIDPLNMNFVKLYEQAAVAADLPEAAVLTLEVAREHNPKDAVLVERLGHLYLSVNDTHEARGCFEDLIKLRPKDQKALKALKDSAALDTMKSGGWEGAGSYRDVMKDQKEAVLLEQEAKSVKAASGTEALIEDTLSKIAKEPENVKYRRALGELYVRADRFEEAIEVLQQALDASGGADPELDRAIINARLSQLENAVAELREAGDTAAADAKEAEKNAFVFQAAQDRVKKYPNDLLFKYDLGVLLYERDRLNEAIQLFQASQRNPQRRIRSLYYLALCFKSKEQYDIATQQLQSAASELPGMDQTKKEILYELGQLMEVMGKPDEAATYYKQIYAVDIGFKDVADKIEKGLSG